MSTIKYNFEKLIEIFHSVLCRSKALRADQWIYHLIINPGAGGFNFEGIRQSLGRSEPKGIRILDETSRAAIAGLDPLYSAQTVDIRLHLSAYPDHAGLLAKSIATDFYSDERRHMIISIGGDGTHNEIMQALHTGVSQSKLALCRVFRFPLGSGNDGADAWKPEEAWQLLIDGAEQGRAGALEINSAAGEQFHAFNIASIGVDAHIVKVTNQLKDRLPGDFYKVAADLSVPFYPGLYQVGTARLSGVDFDGEQLEHSFRLGLIAFGVSGIRTYGHGLWILPDRENICAIELRNLLTNIKMKKELYRAKHDRLPYVSMFRSGDFTFEYDSAIPMELDGEVKMLSAEDFPLSIRVIETNIQMYSGKDLSVYKS